jgi:hypothetical protein
MQDSYADPFLRPLSPLEHYCWVSDQNKPKHFVITAQIKGETEIASWRSALDAVQGRHPMLNVGISPDSSGRPFFTQPILAPIPLRIVYDGANHAWEQEVARERAMPFGLADIPLLRAALIYGKESSTLILSAHHAVADGLSLAYVIRDILDALSGRDLITLSSNSLHREPSLVDEVDVGRVTELPKFAEARLTDQYFDGNPYNFTTRSLCLSLELSRNLRETAHQQSASVHGALVTALVLAGRQLVNDWNKQAVRVLSPISIRNAMGLNDESAMAVVFPVMEYDPQSIKYFWKTAHCVKSDLDTIRNPKNLALVLDNLRQLLAVLPGKAEMKAVDMQVLSCDLVVSNLGVLPLQRQYGGLTLKALWGPAILLGFQNEQMVGVSTVNDSIHLLHSSYEPVPLLLETAEQILLTVLQGAEER